MASTRNSTNANASEAVPVTLRERLRERAREVGFDAFGVCLAEALEPERGRYLRWIRDGNQGQMAWITPEWARQAGDPRSALPGARSVVCIALSYDGPAAGFTPEGMGRMARYGNGEDYHELLAGKLESLAELIHALGGATRTFVDTAPTMDKALAVRAGLGWQGKNTNVLSRELGSFMYLGGLMTDLQIEPDAPAAGGCGACRACIAVCPTGALNGDYTIDARVCISYLTIEHRGSIPRHLRSRIGDWVFGCDLCQDVCPPVAARQDRIDPIRTPERVRFARSLLASAARTH